MRRFLMIMLAAVISGFAVGARAEGDAVQFLDADVRWENIGGTQEERKARSEAWTEQQNAYAALRSEAKAAFEAENWTEAEAKSLAAAEKTPWSRVSAQMLNNAGYAVILAFKNGEVGVDALARASKSLADASAKLEIARACDVCREQLSNWDAKIEETAALVESNKLFISDTLKIEEKKKAKK